MYEVSVFLMQFVHGRNVPHPIFLVFSHLHFPLVVTELRGLFLIPHLEPSTNVLDLEVRRVLVTQAVLEEGATLVGGVEVDSLPVGLLVDSVGHLGRVLGGYFRLWRSQHSRSRAGRRLT
jgi:hypothetical protein